MTFKPGVSGNSKGRPPRAAQMSAALSMTAERIAELLPNVRLTAHDLLRAIYCDERFPLAVRFQAATACLPVEKPRLSATAIVEGPNERLADRLYAAQARLGMGARDVLALEGVAEPDTRAPIAPRDDDPLAERFARARRRTGHQRADRAEAEAEVADDLRVEDLI
ncbi:MAG: hypothetical protein HIU82_13940 [Proteobacteria bacterium]|nr:hypothetical protein [Pseudomonadota bacterium]